MKIKIWIPQGWQWKSISWWSLAEPHTLNPKSTFDWTNAHYSYIPNPTGSYNVTDPPPRKRWSQCSFSLKLGFDLLWLQVMKSIVITLTTCWWSRLSPKKDLASESWNKSSCLSRKGSATNREILKESLLAWMWKTLWRGPQSYHLLTSGETQKQKGPTDAPEFLIHKKLEIILSLANIFQMISYTTVTNTHWWHQLSQPSLLELRLQLYLLTVWSKFISITLPFRLQHR